MDRWFGNTIYESFEPFTASHITILVIFMIGLVYLFLCYRFFQQHSTLYTWTRWILFSFLLLSEIGYQTWAITNGVWSFADHVPLHLCGVASIICMIALVTKHPKLIQWAFFIGIVPPFLALITPELVNDFPHFRFWKFFVHHMTITWTGLFLVLSSHTKVTFSSLIQTFGFLNVYAFVIFFVNKQIGSNYLYLSRTPTANTPLDLLGEGVWYYLNLELVTFSVFFLLFGLYKFFSKKDPTHSNYIEQQSAVNS